MTMPFQQDDNVVKIEARRKVSLRFKAIRMIDLMTELMYCEAVQLQMQKQGYSVEPEDLAAAKKATKMKLLERHLDGKTTKQLPGAISTLKKLTENLKKDMTALTLNMPEVKHGHPATNTSGDGTDERDFGENEGDPSEGGGCDY